MAWNFNSDKPIYQQIAKEITLRIIGGDYKSGGRIDAVRDLAVEAGVNPNTMQRALSLIEETGIIITRRGEGRFITDDLEKIDSMRKQCLSDIGKDFIEVIKKLGISKDELIELIKNSDI